MDNRIVKSGKTYKVLSRGVVIVDHGLQALGSELSKLNIRVIATDGIPEEYMIESILPQRILVTNRPNKFLDDVYNYEYGIVSIGRFKKEETQAIAKKISHEIARRKLMLKKFGYILKLKNNGKSEFVEMIG